MAITVTKMAIMLTEMAFTLTVMAISVSVKAIIFFKKGVMNTLFERNLTDFQFFIILPIKEEQGQEQKQYQSVLCFKYCIAKSVGQY
jgi:hypothetical protein